MNVKTDACRNFRWPLGVIVAIVLLRLVTGWHFYREGTKKLTYNPTTGERRVRSRPNHSSAAAVGPWADWFKRDLPNFHQWETLLVVPRPASDAGRTG